MQNRARYMLPLNEAELFEWGATSWRLDIVTYRALKAQIARIEWERPDGMPDTFDGFVHDKPIGRMNGDLRREMSHVITEMINDPSLTPGLSQMGYFTLSGLEIQNGSYDDAWHHDGLAGKRMGHAGDFFIILYFGEPSWDDQWGGHFEYAKRSLPSGWPGAHFAPEGEVRRIAPVERNALIGWNQNPRLIHRALPLRAPKDRVTLIASIDINAR